MNPKQIWELAPRSTKRKLLHSAVRNPRKTIKRAKRLRKLYKIYKKLPGFDSKFAGGSKWHYKGEQHFLDEDGVGKWEGPANTWLFRPITAPIEKWVNEKAPMLRRPKPTHRRKKGKDEMDLLNPPKTEVQYFDQDGNRLDL